MGKSWEFFARKQLQKKEKKIEKKTVNNELTTSAKKIKLMDFPAGLNEPGVFIDDSYLKSKADNSELFFNQEMRDEAKKEKVEILNVKDLYPFKDHPFKVADDEKMLETVESVKQYGVLTPIVVRERRSGASSTYDIISGHSRKRACELAGITKIPTIIKKLDDDEAVIFMVDSNLQRESITPMEKAHAYKMKLEAMKRQGKNTEMTSTQVAGKLRNNESADIIGIQMVISGDQVRRFVRLTKLIPEFCEMVDNRKIAFNPAVEISYLEPEAQKDLVDIIEAEQATPSLSQAQRMKRFAQEERLDRNVMEAIMQEEKPNQQEYIKLKTNNIKKYFLPEFSAFEIEYAILEMVKAHYRKRQNNKSEPER